MVFRMLFVLRLYEKNIHHVLERIKKPRTISIFSNDNSILQMVVCSWMVWHNFCISIELSANGKTCSGGCYEKYGSQQYGRFVFCFELRFYSFSYGSSGRSGWIDAFDAVHRFFCSDRGFPVGSCVSVICWNAERTVFA